MAKIVNPLTDTRLRKSLKKVAAPQTGWLDEFDVVMGKADGTVLTGINGLVWVHHALSGQDFTVYNFTVPNIPLLQVRVGKRVDQPGLWQVKGTVESFNVPSSSASGSSVNDHHEQHEFPNHDTTWINRKQILYFSALVKDRENFIIQIFGGVFVTTTGLGQVNSQPLDVLSYKPTTGARIITIQTDDDGVVSVVSGDEYDSPFIGTFQNIPQPDADKHLMFCVMLHESMTELLNEHIFIPHMFHGGGTTFVVWGNISGTLADQTDLKAELDGKSDVDHEHEGGTGLIPVTEDVEVECFRFDVSGSLAVASDASISVVVTRYITLGHPYMYCKNNGTSSSTIVDVNVNGSTIYTTSGNRPTLSHDETYDVAALPDVVDLVPGDVITIDIDQIAGGTPDGLSLILNEVIHDFVFDGSELVVEEP